MNADKIACLSLTCFVAAAILMTVGCAPRQETVSRRAARTIPWRDRVIPLPKEMTVTAAKRTHAETVVLDMQAVPADAPVTPTIRRLLSGWAQGQPDKAAVILHLQLVNARTPASEHVAFLNSTPNKDQAYAIWCEPPAPDGIAHLHALANTPVGLLYAARTLTQLVKSPETITPKTTLVIPLLTIHDWPDLAERDEAMTDVDYAWIARWKLNLHEGELVPAINAEGNPYLGQSNAISNLIVAAEAEGVKELPYLYHLAILARPLWGFLGNTNFPQLQTVIRTLDPKQTLNPYLNYRGVYGLCMSNPTTQELLTGWMMAMAKLVKDHHRELEVWLSEEPHPCFCEKCRGKNQYALETQVILRAYEKVKEKYPGTKLRIWTSQGSFREAEQNKLVFELLPPGVGIGYYNGTLTYCTSYEPLIYPLLAQEAQAGRFVGVVPQITSNMRIIVPWTAPQFVQMRCQEFVDKKLSSVSAFVVPNEKWHEFNVMALAEWSWNAHGRSAEEFARAYATVTGICDPALFAEWAVLAGSAGMELAESNFIGDMRGSPGRMGNGFRKKYESKRLADAARRQEMIANARKAEQIAAQTKVPSMVYESIFTRAQLEAFDSLWNSADLLDTATLGVEQKTALAQELNRLDACAQRVRYSLVQWGTLHGTPPWWHERLTKTIPPLLRTCDAAWNRAMNLGLTDPRPESRNEKMGEWTINDFATNNPVFRFDITDKVAPNSGAYHVVFTMTNGFAPWVNTVMVYAVRSGGAATSALTRVEQGLRVTTGTPRYLFEETRLTLPPAPAGSRVMLEVPMELDGRISAAIKKNPKDSICAGTIGWRRVYEMEEWKAQGLILP